MTSLSSLAQHVQDDTTRYHAGKAKTYKDLSDMYSAIAGTAKAKGNRIRHWHYKHLANLNKARHDYHNDVATKGGAYALDKMRKVLEGKYVYIIPYGGRPMWRPEYQMRGIASHRIQD